MIIEKNVVLTRETIFHVTFLPIFSFIIFVVFVLLALYWYFEAYFFRTVMYHKEYL